MDTGRENKVNKYCFNGYNTEQECFDKIAYIIKDYNI